MFLPSLIRFCDDEMELEVQVKFMEVKDHPKAQITFQNITETRQNSMVSPFVVNFEQIELQRNYVHAFRFGRDFFRRLLPLLSVREHLFIGIDALGRFVVRTFHRGVTLEHVRMDEASLVEGGDVCFTTFRFGQCWDPDD